MFLANVSQENKSFVCHTHHMDVWLFSGRQKYNYVTGFMKKVSSTHIQFTNLDDNNLDGKNL